MRKCKSQKRGIYTTKTISVPHAEVCACQRCDSHLSGLGTSESYSRKRARSTGTGFSSAEYGFLEYEEEEDPTEDESEELSNGRILNFRDSDVLR